MNMNKTKKFWRKRRKLYIKLLKDLHHILAVIELKGPKVPWNSLEDNLLCNHLIILRIVQIKVIREQIQPYRIFISIINKKKINKKAVINRCRTRIA